MANISRSFERAALWARALQLVQRELPSSPNHITLLLPVGGGLYMTKLHILKAPFPHLHLSACCFNCLNCSLHFYLSNLICSLRLTQMSLCSPFYCNHRFTASFHVFLHCCKTQFTFHFNYFCILIPLLIF